MLPLTLALSRHGSHATQARWGAGVRDGEQHERRHLEAAGRRAGAGVRRGRHDARARHRLDGRAGSSISSAQRVKARPEAHLRADLGGDARAGRAARHSAHHARRARPSSISPSTAPTSSTTSCASSRAAAARCCARRSSPPPRERMVVIADASKRVATLGKFPLPVEVVRFGLAATRNMVEVLAADAGCTGEIKLRLQRRRPAVRDRRRQLHPRLRLRPASTTPRRWTRR